MPSNRSYRISFLSTFFFVIIYIGNVFGGTDPNTLLKQWNAIITNDFTSVSEIEGRTFIAGNYNASNSHQYGFKLTSNSSSDVVFAVKGSVNATQLAGIKVFYGSAAVSSAVSTPSVFQFMNGGTLSASSSWPAANSPVQDIITASNYWKTLTPNGTVQLPGSQPAPLKFICPTGQKLAVFYVTDTQSLENSNAQQIEVTPADSTETIIINVNSVDGNVNWSNGNLVGNFDNEYWRSRIIWNIYTEANNGNMGTISCNPNMKGSLISPTATLSGNSNFDGNVVCKNLQINSEIHLASSTGWNGNAPSAVQNNASIGDKVWLDANKNGIQDASENGIANVTVKLFDAANTLIGTTTTDANGVYGFSGLAAGTYTVQFVAPSGYTISSKDQGSDDAKDSDADATTGKTASVTLAAGDNNLTVDAGMYVTPASLGDKVWLDVNKNGIQDSGEAGLANVTVKLYDSSNNLVSTTTTNASGIYGFSNLAPGTYYVQFVAPSGYTISAKDQGSDDAKDSDADATTGKTASVTLAAGDNNLTVDAGMYVTPASLGDKVWLDANKDGIQDAGENGIANVTVKLYDASNNLVSTTTTNASGIYGFSNLTPGTYYVQFIAPSGYTISAKDQGSDDAKDSDADATTGKTASVTLAAGDNNLTVDAGMFVTPASLGDKVWLDANKDGIQDASENGIANVTVKLYDSSNNLVSTTTTNASGIYGFSNLAPGTYSVQFVAPSGYTISPKDQGSDDAKDSDADATTGKTASVTLAAGDNNLTVDAGMYVTPASLGDKVWLDANHDGIQDGSEVGLANVTVNLYDASNTLVGTTTTNANGIYGFSNLTPGTYTVQFVAPTGYTISSKDQGSDDSKDSDADAATGKTASVTLAAGQANLTIDAGMYYNNAADLKIEKTVSDSVLSCGKNLTYTIKLTNNGPINAGSIIAADILPAGLSFVSASATQGSYDTTTGKWIVGSLANGASATLTIQVKVDCSAMNNANIDLGPVKDFNVFVLEDITQPSADTQGKLAVGRNATLGCYSVGDQLPASNGTVDVLVVGNNLTYTTGAVYGGNAVYGGSSNLPKSSVSFASGSVRKDSVIDFVAAKSYLENLSTQLAGYAVNGVTTFEWGAVKMVSTSPYINVFSVNGNDLNSANAVQIDVPNGSVVIVNVSGTSINWHGGLVVNGTAINNVLYNFPQATSLGISGINVTGSVLAPFASLNFPAGIITGQTIVKSMSGSGQFNIAPFLGNIPANKSIVNVASIVSSDITDINSSNDVASVSAAFPQDPSGSSSGSGSTGSWQLVGNLPSGATVTCIKADQSGNIYAGTVWGYIYKSSDNGSTWLHVNPDMYSGPIWAIAIHSNGNIFAASVTGVYKTSDNCATWNITDLQNLDVRALKIDASGEIYAGTWNNGVFVSNDNGASFTSANNGLGAHNVVTSLAVTPNQNVFVGTFDGGVAKSTDKGNSWVSMNVGYNYIWTLASNSNGDLFAGTYGDGIYRSTDNGTSWSKMPFPGTYAYELVIDASNNIFASSYSGGVYVSTNNGSTWTNIGMGGMSLSSMMIVPDGKIMYTGTAAGKIFMKKSNLTAVSSTGNSKPAEFSLNQNYPNPFNPSTVISYAVPYESKVILKVYNITGQEVFELVNGTMASGNYQVSMNASNLPSGMYIYRMNAVSADGKHQFSTTKKMMLIK